MKSLHSRLDIVEKRLTQRRERNYEHEIELFGRSVHGDEQAFEEWTTIVINDRTAEPPAPFFRALHQGVAVNFASANINCCSVRNALPACPLSNRAC